MFLVLYPLIIWGNGMTEKTELDDATDELRKAEQRFSDYWKQTSDLNKILFNLEMDKIFKSFKIRCRYLSIQDKLNSLEIEHKANKKYTMIFGSIWALFVAVYILVYQTSGDKFITFIAIFGIFGINGLVRYNIYQGMKNCFTTILDVIRGFSDYELGPGPTKHRYGKLNDRTRVIPSHLLFNYINHNLGENDLEKIQTETEIVRYRIKLLHNIETEMSESKPLEQREDGWFPSF